MSDLRELYQEVILDHSRQPRNFRKLPAATGEAKGDNPLCGDRVRMQVRLEDGRVSAARFVGDSCAICTASADVVVDLIAGRPRGEAAALAVADVLNVLQAEIRPTRMRCVTLPLSVLAQALGGARQP